MHLASAAFEEGGTIPARYTCEGRNVSPPLKWTGVPDDAKSLVLLADDPDAPAGTWVHWVLYDLPATACELAEALPRNQYTPAGAKQGVNSFGHLGYGGPCPPPGKAHCYNFRIYALDALLDLRPCATREDVERAMATHVLSQAQLTGMYERK